MHNTHLHKWGMERGGMDRTLVEDFLPEFHFQFLFAHLSLIRLDFRPLRCDDYDVLHRVVPVQFSEHGVVLDERLTHPL
jgi:hypothetical protein